VAFARGSTTPEEEVEEWHDDGPTVVSLEPPEASAVPVAISPPAPVAAPEASVDTQVVLEARQVVPAPMLAEDYLNAVLGSGVAAPREKPAFVDDGLPVERWGQRVQRPFLWMWLGLGVALLGATGWYLGDMWARNAAVRRHLELARAGLLEMSADSLSVAENEATLAIARDPASIESVAMLANARAFALLVYGDGQLVDVETAIAAARQRAKELGEAESGRRELLLASAAFALSAQSRGVDVKRELDDQRGELDAALTQWPEEPLVYWLNGLSRLHRGDRAGARDAFKQAQGMPHGLMMARVALADLDLDEGAFQAAAAGYDEVLKASPRFSLALSGRALARAETGTLLAETASELESGGAVKVEGKRAEAWHRLALSRLIARTGDRERARVELDAAVATGTADARFLARVALALLEEGRYEDAFTARTRIRARAADLLLPAIDAELLLAGGRPDEAINTVGAGEDPRSRAVRGRALYDVGRYEDAIVQLGVASAKLSGDAELAAWLALANLAAQKAPITPLVGLAERGTAAQALLGEGYLLTGDRARAQKAFETALMDPTGGRLSHRAATQLALMHLDAGKPADAETQARAALAAAPGYLPAHAALGRALVAGGKQSDAGAELQLVVDAGRATAADELAYAEAALAQGQPDAAREAVVRARTKGATGDALVRVATLVDPQLAAELGAASSAPSAKAPARPKRRR
jgi:tetratricopeptide (TPR) repeat protein